MGTVTYSDGIAIWKVIYYTPALVACIYICGRHGFLKSSGWFFLVTFCITRLIGSCAQLATIGHVDGTAETIALVCTLMGTTPLLLSSLGLLSRIYYSILSQIWSIVFQFGVLKIVQTPTVVALILCIVGATSASSPAQIESEATLHAGIVLYAIVFVMLCLLATIAICYRRKVPDQERILINAVVIALPFILVHIIYSLCTAFSDDSAFDPISGSTTIFLFMSVLEEMTVVVIYIYAGFRIRSTPLPADASAARQLGYRTGRGDFGTGKLGLLSLGLGVLDAFRSTREKVQLDDHPQRDHRHRGPSTAQDQRTYRHDKAQRSSPRRTTSSEARYVRREQPGRFTSQV